MSYSNPTMKESVTEWDWSFKFISLNLVDFGNPAQVQTVNKILNALWTLAYPGMESN